MQPWPRLPRLANFSFGRPALAVSRFAAFCFAFSNPFRASSVASCRLPTRTSFIALSVFSIAVTSRVIFLHDRKGSSLLLSVPKILTLFIPEILSRPAIAGRAKTLSVPPVGKPVGRREEDVRNVKASRNRDSTEGWSLQGRSGPSGGSVPVLC